MEHFRFKIRITTLILGIFLFNCSSDNPESPYHPALPRALNSSEISLISSDNTFSFKIFKEIINFEKDPCKNIFISPFSIASALSMTLNGATGETKEAMMNTLELNNLSLEEINQSYLSLIELLTTNDQRVTLQLANSIWYRLGLNVKQDFIDVNKKHYNAEVTSLDFSAPETLDIINGWVERNTNGRIKNLVKPIDLEVGLMLLINAIFFKGIWTYQFDPAYTYPGSFYLPDETHKSCRMMFQETTLSWFENNNFKAVDLSYGYGNFSMTILLPHNGININEFVFSITQENWESCINNFSEQEGEIHLPRINLEYEIRLDTVLINLGMEPAFYGGFEKIAPGLFIGKVLHKSFLEVNEQGTEAAAATMVRLDGPSDYTMILNRPFLFVIRENNTGAILFMGKIVNPVP